jgi:hypothetical protein
MFFSREDNWRRHMLRHKLEDESELSQQVVDEEIKIGPNQRGVEDEVATRSEADEIKKLKSVHCKADVTPGLQSLKAIL